MTENSRRVTYYNNQKKQHGIEKERVRKGERGNKDRQAPRHTDV